MTAWTRESAVSALRAWARARDGFGPRTSDYAGGSGLPYPVAVRRLWGGDREVAWRRALRDAGLVERPKLSGSGPRAVSRRATPQGGWSRSEALGAYRAWAKAHGGVGPRSTDLGRDLSLPSPVVVRRLFGTYEAACEAAGLEMRARARRLDGGVCSKGHALSVWAEGLRCGVCHAEARRRREARRREGVAA